MPAYYNFKTEQRQTREGTTLILGESYLRAHNLSTPGPKKLLLLEIAGIKTAGFTTDDYTANTYWLKNSNVAEPPEGSTMTSTTSPAAPSSYAFWAASKSTSSRS
jgi:hypothetical protein